MVRRQGCYQRPRNGGLGISDLENHWFAERLAYLGWSLPNGTVWRRKASDTFPRLKSDPKAEGRRKLRGEGPFVQWSFSVSKGTVSRSSAGLPFGSSRESVRLVDGGGSLALELGVRFRLLEQLLAHLAACTEYVTPFRLELQSGPGRHVRLSSLRLWLWRNDWACLLLLWADSSVLESCQRVDDPYRTQAARAARRCMTE